MDEVMFHNGTDGHKINELWATFGGNTIIHRKVATARRNVEYTIW
jgi:hypothetical protein